MRQTRKGYTLRLTALRALVFFYQTAYNLIMAKGKKTGGRRRGDLCSYTLRLTGSAFELEQIRSNLLEKSKVQCIPMSRVAVDVFLQELNNA
jgi:hypothetical protein